MQSRILLLSILLVLFSLPDSLYAQYRNRYPLPPGGTTASLGVNIHFTDPQPGEMKLMAEGGFHWIRMDFAWSGIEKEKGQYDFAAYDHLLKALDEHHIRPIFILDYGNDLYQSGPPTSPQARVAFTRFVAAALTHFRNRGIVWEMWNEPNIEGFWKPRPNAEEYVILAAAVGKTVREVAPEEWFIGAATSTIDYTFLEKCFQGGMLNYWDAVSVHPYRNTPPETALPEYQRLRALVDRYAPKGKTIPLINSEWGYSELYPGLSQELQTKYIVRHALVNLVAGTRVSIWYDWKDDGTDPKEAEHHFGSVYSDLKPKPTFLAFQNLTRTLNGFQYNKRLALDSPNDYCLLFSKGNEARLVVWTTSPGTHEVQIPVSEGKFTLSNFRGIQSEIEATGSPSLAKLKLRLTDVPQYVVPHGENALLKAAAAWPTIPAQTALNANMPDNTRWSLFAPLNDPRSPLSAPGNSITVENVSEPLLHPQSQIPIVSKITIKPGADKRAEVVNGRFDQEKSDLSETPRRFRVTLHVADLGEVAQDTEVISATPLRLKLYPIVGNTLIVEAENPAGKPFSGTLTTTLQGQQQEQLLKLAEGEKSKQIKITVPTAQRQDYTIAAELRQEGSAYPALTLPLQQMRVLEDFAAYSTDSALPDNTYQTRPDGDPKIKSTIDTKVVAPPPGLPSQDLKALRIDYDFAPGWKFLQVEPKGKNAVPLPGKPEKLGLWVHGDASGDMLRMRFTDATSQTFQPDYGPIDWKGWRYITFTLNGQNGGRWGGANDGVIHYPIRLDTILLIDSPGGRGGKGSVVFTGVTLMNAH